MAGCAETGQMALQKRGFDLNAWIRPLSVDGLLLLGAVCLPKPSAAHTRRVVGPWRRPFMSVLVHIEGGDSGVVSQTGAVLLVETVDLTD